MTPIPSSVISDYDGELKNSGDEREAQILYEFDSGFNLLRDCAIQNGLSLPPLFDKSYIDHGCVTGKALDMFAIIVKFIEVNERREQLGQHFSFKVLANNDIILDRSPL